MDEISVRFLLHPGERLLWEGRPEKRFRYRGKDCLVYLACLAGLCLVAALSQKRVNRFTSSLFLLLWIALPFVQVLFRPSWRAKRCYAVTDERVIIAEPQEVQSLLYQDIYVMVKDFRKDGSGTIWFREPRKLNNDSYDLKGKRGKYSYTPGMGFQEIADAEWVYRLIEEQIRLHSRQI